MAAALRAISANSNDVILSAAEGAARATLVPALSDVANAPFEEDLIWKRALARCRHAYLFVPIVLYWKASTKTRLIDGTAQERGFPFGISWHVVAVCCGQVHLQRFVGARDLRVLDEPVAKQ